MEVGDLDSFAYSWNSFSSAGFPCLALIDLVLLHFLML